MRMKAVALERLLYRIYSWLPVRWPPAGRLRSLTILRGCMYFYLIASTLTEFRCLYPRPTVCAFVYQSRHPEIFLHRSLLLLIRRWALCLDAFNEKSTTRGYDSYWHEYRIERRTHTNNKLCLKHSQNTRLPEAAATITKYSENADFHE
ncbi:hypothetical protein BDW60DRAFT_151230 [Aspergillus nidulans var. acristatus]